ncbi:hypothetical protein Pcinc_009560 [Petrolisthes cinctipes]|uniref:Uncharacterized protein n=1 Tax=Petrolisthes cinctipes TaxID=88211 RepID=A0AAE1G761_PETCI|nr:hypothetical protein Pcinc_009560 [Petrolisthes cinctipes]
MRQKVHTFISFLPSHLQYTFYLGSKQVDRSLFLQAVSYHMIRTPTFNIIGKQANTVPQEDTKKSTGPSTVSFKNSASRPHDNSAFHIDVPQFEPFMASLADFESISRPLREEEVSQIRYELRVTMLWATGERENRTEVDKMEEWLADRNCPHVIVVGLGTWKILQRQVDDELSPFTSVQAAVQPLLFSLTRLAATTTVLYWAQSRYRWFNYEGDKVISATSRHHDKFWENMLYLNMFNDSIPLIDAVMWRHLRMAGAWLWDSTVPLNMANLRECHKLIRAGLLKHKLFTGWG